MNRHPALISIDFWDTIVAAHTGGEQRTEARYAALRTVAHKYNQSITAEDIETASQKASDEFYRAWFDEQRTPDSRELVDHIVSDLQIPATDGERNYLTEAFEQSLSKGPPELLPNVKQVIEELADRYALAIISDTMYSPGSVLREFLSDHNLLAFFDSFVFSNEAGFSKPNPKAYQLVLEETGCRAEHSYHIGDRLNTDIAGAKKAGMKAILFTGVSEKDNGTGSDIRPDHRCQNWQEIKTLLL